MELRHYLRLLVKWLWLMALSAAVAGASTYMAVRSQPATYATTTTLMIGRALESLNPDSSEIYMGEQLAITYSELAQREPVLRGAIESLGIDMAWESLAGRVSVELVTNTQLMEITVVDTNPYRAQALADAIAQQIIALTPGASAESEERVFAEEQLADLKTKIDQAQDEIDKLIEERDAAISARRIQDLDSQITTLDSKVSGWQSTYSELLVYLEGGDVNVIQVVEEAAVPQYPISSSPLSNVALAAAIGVALAVGGALLVEYLDDSVKDQAEVEQRLGLPTLGAIARVPQSDVSPESVTLSHPASPYAEAYRMLLTNVRFCAAPVGHSVSIVITSAGPREGKTTTACNLAVALAQSGEKVVLVDADLRRPRVHTTMRLENTVGLSSLLVRDAEWVGLAVQPSAVPNLQVLTSGPTPPNAAELLGSPRMTEIISDLCGRVDFVLLDAPPALAVADAAILSAGAMGTILVYEMGRTRLGALVQSAETIKKAGGNILGLVVNRLSLPRGRHGYYNDYYKSVNIEKKEKKTQRKEHRSKKNSKTNPAEKAA